jgi:hypothetical protein
LADLPGRLTVEVDEAGASSAIEATCSGLLLGAVVVVLVARPTLAAARCWHDSRIRLGSDARVGTNV